MQKTKLGVSVGLLGAALYFMGTISIIPLVILGGYVLLFEEHEGLKRTAVKSLAIVIAFSIALTVLGLVGNCYSVVGDIFLLVRLNLHLDVFNRILSIARTVVYFMQALLLLVCGLKALHGDDFKVGIIDNILDKHM